MNGTPPNFLEEVIRELLAIRRTEVDILSRRLDRLEQRLSEQPTTTSGSTKKLELALRAGELLTQIGPPLWRGIIWLAPRVVLWGGLLQAGWSMLRRLIGL
jgi:hypothetical protein